jgi:CheY-like chemotaxis protein
MSTRRILVVDDNLLNVELVRFILEAAGFELSIVNDATQAISHIRARLPDLILMDIQLPGIDGLELTRRLKADPETSAITVVAFTAYAMKGDEAKMRAAGCDGYLSKPIDVATFADQVRGYLRATAS